MLNNGLFKLQPLAKSAFLWPIISCFNSVSVAKKVDKGMCCTEIGHLPKKFKPFGERNRSKAVMPMPLSPP